MNAKLSAETDQPTGWHFARSLSELKQSKALKVRIAGKQIALFHTPQGVRACDNNCPHEGYPLSEGSLSEDCTLTCNWHNWKFNLNTGDNLYGGDLLRIYPVELRGDEIWVDITDPPYEERYTLIVENLCNAFHDHSYDRIGREIARLIKLGADPLDALRLSIQWSWNRMEFGWTHAYAGMAEWLTLYQEQQGNEELQLVCLLESVGHVAFDVLREREYPFTNETQPFDEVVFLNAIEQEDEDTAVATIRGGLRDGLEFKDFEKALTHAALAHYNDFGHSLIYVTKAGDLIRQLGNQVAEPLLLSLVREFIYATREEKIPEFRGYDKALSAWRKNQHQNGRTFHAQQWHRKGIDKALDLALAFSHSKPETVYQELLTANAINLLSYDIAQQDKVHVSVSGNVGWLSFTHGLTFANAVRKQCARFPELWPQGLLQMACFSGRNAAFTTPDYDVDQWCSSSALADVQEIINRVFDHGLDEYIVSVHWLKTAMAVREEMQQLPEEKARILAASLNRFIHSPLKRKQARRTAYQSIQFVARE